MLLIILVLTGSAVVLVNLGAAYGNVEVNADLSRESVAFLEKDADSEQDDDSGLRENDAQHMETAESTENAEIKAKGLRGLAESSQIMQLARAVKADYMQLVQSMKEQDTVRATLLREQTEANIRELEGCFDSALWRATEKLPVVGREVSAAKELLKIAKTANSKLIAPMIEQLEKYPFESLRTESGISADFLLAYLDFAENVWPDAKLLFQRFTSLDKGFLELIDSSGKLSKYSDLLAELIDQYEPYLEHMPLLREALGENGDKLYVFAAQNTAEIRASGGFPGSVGAIEIKNGIISLDDFQSVYDVFTEPVLEQVRISDTENIIYETRMNLSWDADFCPDFERVGEIWALAYQDHNGKKVDGVISATPVVIQRLLSFLGEITLSDGTVLNGENATRVLQHDIYFKYMSKDINLTPQEANGITDQLFSETAKKTQELAISTIGLSHICDYISFLKQSFGDRTLLMWMADVEAQTLLRQLGWSGSLNRDEAKPAVGVFFNSIVASKMGWFLDIDVSVGEAVNNEDGTTTYPISVCFSNRITPEELNVAGYFILGDSFGFLTGGMYVFAPAGGTISNYRTSTGQLKDCTYRDLEMIYEYNSIGVQSDIVIECDITTAPGECSRLTVMHTPTGQEYR